MAMLADPSDYVGHTFTYLELDLGLRNVLLAAASAGNLLGLGDLASDGLSAEVLEREALNGVDAQLRTRLHNRESTGNYTTG